ncbi:MAG: hypothetical protein Q8L98_02200 [Chlamydiales bacterium]|nr:hypothetical protein [Chlamydiales bacterium]
MINPIKNCIKDSLNNIAEPRGSYKERAPLASRYFEALVKKPYQEEKTDVLDDLLFDLLLTAEEGNLRLLQEEFEEVQEMDANNLHKLLWTVKLLAKELPDNSEKRKKIEWVQEKIKQILPLADKTPFFNKRLEEKKNYLQNLKKEKNIDLENDTWAGWAKRNKTTFLTFAFGSFLIGAVACLPKQAFTIQKRTFSQLPEINQEITPLLITKKKTQNQNFKIHSATHDDLELCEAPSPAPVKPQEKLQKTPIQLVTGYAKGNPERDEMSQLVIDSQRQYAKTYNYAYEAFTENLATECYNIENLPQSCEPQWSKIQIIRNWLMKPAPASQLENWLVWLDDDMPITNHAYRLEDIIKNLRKGPQTHLIVTQDIQPQTSLVNTGALLVRHSPESQKIFDEIWAKRTFQVLQHTTNLGTCKNQICLHEQSALEMTLKTWEEKENPLRQAVAVVAPRTYFVALNTIARENYYIDKNRNNRELKYYSDMGTFRWQEGDFAGQCSGVPINGFRKNPKFPPSECIDFIIASQSKLKSYEGYPEIKNYDTRKCFFPHKSFFVEEKQNCENDVSQKALQAGAVISYKEIHEKCPLGDNDKINSKQGGTNLRLECIKNLIRTTVY